MLFNRGTDRRAAQPQADAPIEAQAAGSAEGDNAQALPSLNGLFNMKRGECAGDTTFSLM